MDNNQGKPGQNQGGQPAEKIARGVVARGRTVDIPDTTRRQVIGHTPEGKPIHRSPVRSFGPGNEIELPAQEIATLRERGFLVDPERVIPPLADGPHFTETGAHATAS